MIRHLLPVALDVLPQRVESTLEPLSAPVQEAEQLPLTFHVAPKLLHGLFVLRVAVVQPLAFGPQQFYLLVEPA